VFFKQKLFAIIASTALILLIAVLIKRRRLREEFALLWLITGVAIVALVIGYPALVWISDLIGAKTPTTTLFIFALLFIILISISFSVRFSRLADQIQGMITELAFLRKELHDLKKEGGAGLTQDK
jgi:hypothetical protein